jgi:uncharacterized membrane protein
MNGPWDLPFVLHLMREFVRIGLTVMFYPRVGLWTVVAAMQLIPAYRIIVCSEWDC